MITWKNWMSEFEEIVRRGKKRLISLFFPLRWYKILYHRAYISSQPWSFWREKSSSYKICYKFFEDSLSFCMSEFITKSIIPMIPIAMPFYKYYIVSTSFCIYTEIFIVYPSSSFASIFESFESVFYISLQENYDFFIIGWLHSLFDSNIFLSFSIASHWSIK